MPETARTHCVKNITSVSANMAGGNGAVRVSLVIP